MNKFALAGACLVLSAVSAQAQYVDGLPAATSVSSSDLMPVIQGSTPVVGAGFLPGSGVARRATVGQIAGAVGNSYVPYSGASSAVNLGAFPLTLGVSSAPTAPGSGGTFYVDSTGVLHFKSSIYDFPLAGATFQGSSPAGGGPNWWIGQYAFGEPAAHANDFATLWVKKQVTDNSALGGIYNGLRVTDAVLGPSANYYGLVSNAVSGATTLVIQDNPIIIAVGQPIWGQGIPNGTTISAVQHATPAAGDATITLSQPIGANMYASSQAGPLQVSVGSTTSNESEWSITSTCDSFQTSATSHSCLGGFFSAVKRVPGGTQPFGLDVVSTDATGLRSSVAGAIVNTEFDLQASGPDDGNGFFGTANITGVRHILDIIPLSTGPSPDGATVIAEGAQLRLPSVTFSAHDPVTVNHAFFARNTAGWGSILNGFVADGGNGSGENGLYLFSGTLAFQPASDTTSGTSLTFGTVTVNPGQRVSDASGCIPLGTSVASASEDTSQANTVVTLTNAVTCTVATTDAVTFSNVFNDGWLATGYFKGALADLTTTGGTGLVKIGSTTNTGDVGKISFMGRDSTGTTVVSYGDLAGSVVTNTHGATVGKITVSGALALAQTTVAALPACTSALKGGLMGVTDATAPTYNGTLTGGGAVAIPVYCNGVSWTAH